MQMTTQRFQIEEKKHQTSPASLGEGNGKLAGEKGKARSAADKGKPDQGKMRTGERGKKPDKGKIRTGERVGQPDLVTEMENQK